MRTRQAQVAQLTRVINKGDPYKILFECSRAAREFEETFWPDDWTRWNIAHNDAHYSIYRQFKDMPGIR